MVDFVLVVVVLVPLVLGLVHVAIVLHVRNTLTSAAAEGARYAATIDRQPEAAVSRTRQEIGHALAGRFAEQVSVGRVELDGMPAIRVRVVADVPPLGLWGPATHLEVAGHAVEESAR